MISPFEDSSYRIELNRPFSYNNPFSLCLFCIEQTNDNTPSFENLFSEEGKKFEQIIIDCPFYSNGTLNHSQNDSDSFSVFIQRLEEIKQDNSKEEKNNDIKESKEEQDKVKQTKIFDVQRNAFNRDSLINFDFITYLSFLFIIPSLRKEKGRIKEDIKEQQIFHTKHDREAFDNAKKKIFNRCFKVISSVICNLCKKFGYDFKKIIRKKVNKTNNLNNEVILNYCKMPMEYYLANNEPRNGNKQQYKIMYNKMKADIQFQEAELLQEILNMTLGEVFIKFLEDDNFVKKEDPRNNDFSTFTDNFENEFDELRKNELVKNLRKIAYKSLINE
jgi:hypothetical protein